LLILHSPCIGVGRVKAVLLKKKQHECSALIFCIHHALGRLTWNNVTCIGPRTYYLFRTFDRISDQPKFFLAGQVCIRPSSINRTRNHIGRSHGGDWAIDLIVYRTINECSHSKNCSFDLFIYRTIDRRSHNNICIFVYHTINWHSHTAFYSIDLFIYHAIVGINFPSPVGIVFCATIGIIFPTPITIVAAILIGFHTTISIILSTIVDRPTAIICRAAIVAPSSLASFNEFTLGPLCK
jgi:hypothetical protein